MLSEAIPGWYKSLFVEHTLQRSALQRVLNKKAFIPPCDI